MLLHIITLYDDFLRKCGIISSELAVNNNCSVLLCESFIDQNEMALMPSNIAMNQQR